jgi:TetR/AcrR family transcriptional regulator, transcriptional repressor for nem operon
VSGSDVATPGTAAQVLDVAERLVQVNGFNGFSYADIATELSLTKAALHYHYSGKADLGTALISRYSDRFAESLASIDVEPRSAAEKLRAYVGLYAAVLREHRMCLCGMLAAEYQTLPEPMRDAVVRFFDANEVWVARVLDAGASEGSLSFTGSAQDSARMIISALEGAMLVARPYGDVARFDAAADQLLAGLTHPTAHTG